MGWRYQDMRESERRILGVVFIVALIGGIGWLHTREARAEYGNDHLTVTFDNKTNTTVQIELRDNDKPDIRWSAPDNRDYELNPGETKTTTINCFRGQKICYGAWRNEDGIYWGKGRGNKYQCSDCCRQCGTGHATFRMFVLPTVNRNIERSLGVASGGDVSADPVFQQYCAARLPVHLPAIGEQFGPYTRSELVYVILSPFLFSPTGTSRDDPEWGRTYCAIHAMLHMDKESFDLIAGACQVEHKKDGRIVPYVSQVENCPHLDETMLVDAAKKKLGGWFSSYRYRSWICPQQSVSCP